jgi:hypothetical protein
MCPPPTVILLKEYKHILKEAVSFENLFHSRGLHRQSLPSATDDEHCTVEKSDG